MDVSERQVSVRKGEEITLEFQLQPIAINASLAFSGGVPGAEVWLEQTSLGSVHEDGSFSSTGIKPGDHSIELRKQSYKTRRIEKHFEGNGAVQLTPAEVAMEKLPATIHVNATPADAKITIRRGDGPEQPFNGAPVPEGTYTVTGRAQNYLERSSTFTIAAGEVREIPLPLERAPAPKQAPVDSMSQWDNPSVWALVNNWFVCKGGTFAGYNHVPASGVFEFRIRLDKGKHLQWVAARRDDRNYVHFQMDKKNFYHSQVVNGKEGPITKIGHSLEKEPFYSIQIEITDDTITHRFNDGSRSIVLNEWRLPGSQFANGKFGFLVPRDEVIAISNFRFTPK
jgi:hypothetical protein